MVSCCTHLNNLYHLWLRIKLCFCYCEHKLRERQKRKQETKRKHQWQKPDVIIPAVSESPCLQLVALTYLHKLSSHVYSFGVVTFKAPLVLCNKDQLDSLCRFPFLSPLHCMPRQFLIDSSSSISHVMPKRDRRLSRRKKKVPQLFFLIVNVGFKSKEQSW